MSNDLCVESLGKDWVYLAICYDTVAEQSSQIVYLHNLKIAERFFEASCKQVRPEEIDVYIIGKYNTSTMEIVQESVPKLLDMNPVKLRLNKEAYNDAKER